MLNLHDVMGNVASSLASGFFSAIGKVFGSPLDFLSGKSCSSVCGSTWDFICYIENFCVANLLKMCMVFMLAYFVILLLYLLHKIGIFGCIGRGFCKMIWTCLASYFYAWEYCCSLMCIKLASVKRRRRHHRRRDMEEELESEEGKHRYRSSSDSSNAPEHFESRSSKRDSRRWRKNHRGGSQTRKALRTKSHGVRVRSGRVLVYDGKHRRKCTEVGNHLNEMHSFGVHGSSKLVHKHRKHRRGSHI